MAPARSLRVRTVLRRMALVRLASFKTCRPKVRKSNINQIKRKKITSNIQIKLIKLMQLPCDPSMYHLNRPLKYVRWKHFKIRVTVKNYIQEAQESFCKENEEIHGELCSRNVWSEGNKCVIFLKFLELHQSLNKENKRVLYVFLQECMVIFFLT